MISPTALRVSIQWAAAGRCARAQTGAVADARATGPCPRSRPGILAPTGGGGQAAGGGPRADGRERLSGRAGGNGRAGAIRTAVRPPTRPGGFLARLERARGYARGCETGPEWALPPAPDGPNRQPWQAIRPDLLKLQPGLQPWSASRSGERGRHELGLPARWRVVGVPLRGGSGACAPSTPAGFEPDPRRRHRGPERVPQIVEHVICRGRRRRAPGAAGG